jgi:hypothetical protein
MKFHFPIEEPDPEKADHGLPSWQAMIAVGEIT